MHNCDELTNTESASDKAFIDCVVSEASFEDKTYTNCVFTKIDFDYCLFKDVRFVNCKFYNVRFRNCKSMSMEMIGTELFNSMILQSKFNFTSITRTHFYDFRFYNSIFLRTTFDMSFIAITLFENSLFVNTIIKSVFCFKMSLVSMDFRNSSFNLLHFEEDVDIQKTNFSNCVFIDSDLGSPHITDTIFDYSQFTSLVYTDNSKIVNCSFENVIHVNTNVIATSTPVQIEWPTIVLHMPGSVISTQPQTLSDTITRNYPMTSRLFLGTEGDITHIPKLHEETIRRLKEVQERGNLLRNRITNNRIGIIDIQVTDNQMAIDVIDGEVPLLQHLTENPDTIAFLFQQNYYIATRENIIRMTSFTTEGADDNSIVYECIIADTLRPENILRENPLVKIASLGVATNGSYIPLRELLMVFDNNCRMYEIVSTEAVVESVVSYQVLHGASHFSSSHCQAGQGGMIFKLNKIRNTHTKKRKRNEKTLTGGSGVGKRTNKRKSLKRKSVKRKTIKNKHK